MSHLNEDLYAILSQLFAAHEAKVEHHAVEPWRHEVWDLLRTNGFTSVGSDADLADFAAIASAVGNHAIALPLVEGGVARWIADTLALDLGGVDVVVPSVVHVDDRILATSGGDGTALVTGQLHRVPWARHADAIVLPFVLDDRDHVGVVTSFDVVSPSTNLAGEPRDTVRLNEVVIAAPAFGPGPASDELLSRGALMRAVSALAAMERVLALTLEYAEQRMQFGKPISSFQSVQFHLVTVAEAVARTSAAVDAAVNAPADYRRMFVASAKVIAAEQSGHLARSAHQVFGAIGATEEHPLHLLTRRLWSWQDEFGTARYWSRLLGERLVFADSPGAWEVMTPPTPALADRGLGQVIAW